MPCVRIIIPHTELGQKYYNLKTGRKVGSVSPMKGCKLSAEHKLKLSAAKKGCTPWNKGKRGVQDYDNPDHKKARSIAAKRRWEKHREDTVDSVSKLN